MVAHGPLHRTGRAGLPHPAPTLGDDAKSLERLGMADARRRQPSVDVLACVPRSGGDVVYDAGAYAPESTHLSAKGTQRGAIGGHAVVSGMATDHTAQLRSLFRDGVVHASPQFGFDLLQLGLPPLAHCLPQHRELPVLRVFPQMCVKPRKLKVSGFPSPRSRPVLRREASELDQARLSPGAVPDRTSRTARAAQPGTVRPPSRCWNPPRSRPRSARRSRRRVLASSSIAGPTDRRHSAGRRWPGAD